MCRKSQKIIPNYYEVVTIKLFTKKIMSINNIRVMLVMLILVFFTEMLLMLFLHNLELINPFLLSLIDAISMVLLVSLIIKFYITKNKTIIVELFKTQSELNSFIDNASYAISITDLDGKVKRVNKAFEELFGWQEDEIRNISLPNVPWGAKDEVGAIIDQIINGKNGAYYDTLRLRKDGTQFLANINISAIKDGNNSLIAIACITRDITEQKQSEENIIKSRDFYLTLFNEFPALIWRSGTDAKCNYFNKTWLAFTGRSLEEELGDGWLENVHPEDYKTCSESYKNRYLEQRHFQMEYRLRRHDGQYRWIIDYGRPFYDINGEFLGFIGSCYDITERREAEEKIKYNAYHDYLTGLPNRRKLHEFLSDSLMKAGENNKKALVAFIDLDGFKNVNDTLGHSMGDKLIKKIAKRLLGCLKDNELVGRLGGDEFTLISPELESEQDLEEIANRILSVFEKPCILGGFNFHLTAAVGLSLYPNDGIDAVTLMKNADIAMFVAKQKGKNKFLRYEINMTSKIMHAVNIEHKLRQAIDNNEFIIHYQPQFNIVNNELTGLEALIRWVSPELGLVPPDEFIPLAEETGLIIQIGEWVLRQVCKQIKVWNLMGYVPVKIAINISARQFQEGDIVNILYKCIEETKIHPEMLEFEITESSTMKDPEYTLTTLRKLRSLGVSIAIDDFGTGYSNLSYLKQFPVNKLKIDRSFVKNVTKTQEDAAISKTIITLANNLNIKVIAEGVENDEQAAFLKKQGCHEMQGFLLSRPIEVGEIQNNFLAKLVKTIAN